jgi:hypothetical protein
VTFDPDHVLALLEQKLTRSVIAERLGVRPKSVPRIIESARKAKSQPKNDIPEKSKLTSAKLWTDEEIAEAEDLLERGWRQVDIAQKLGRSESSVNSKLYSLEHQNRVPPDRIAEAEARREASWRRNTTALLMGDPPPGYSARDRRGM